jgi:OFA family oxalate/formate antiporter-like MFS transporter
MNKSYDHIPLAARRYPFFYGWFILGLGAVGFLMSSPGQTYGVAPFTDPLIEVLGLTRVQLSTAYMLGTIASSLCLTWAGKCYDRYGARVVAPASSFMLGIVLALLSQCDHLAQVVASWAPSMVAPHVGFALILVLFFGLRFSGQGVLTMVSRNMMVKWFDRHRGLVTGLSGMVIAPAFSATPALLNGLVNSVGWRQAWIWLALLIGGAFTVVALLFFRDSPEDCGLKPDGPLANRALGAKKDPSRVSVQYTLAQTKRTYTFWIFALSLALLGMYATAMSFHASSIFTTAGLRREQGYLIFLHAALVSIVLRPIVGWLSDRVPLKYLLMAMLGGIVTSSIGLGFLGAGPSRWIVMLGNGLCGAVLGTLASVTWPNFYGREHLGAISGFNMAITVFASAFGPWMFSQSRALTGGYGIGSLAIAAAAAVLAILAWGANNPQRRHTRG